MIPMHLHDYVSFHLNEMNISCRKKNENWYGRAKEKKLGLDLNFEILQNG